MINDLNGALKASESLPRARRLGGAADSRRRDESEKLGALGLFEAIRRSLSFSSFTREFGGVGTGRGDSDLSDEARLGPRARFRLSI